MHKKRLLKMGWIVALILITSVSLFLIFTLTFVTLTPLPSPKTGSATNSGVVSKKADVRFMQLVSPNTGWVLTQEQLLWTTTNGKQWIDITPSGTLAHSIVQVIFLDSSKGWVVISDSKGVEIVITIDGGKSWTIRPIITATNSRTNNYIGKAFLSFTDSLHGWVLLQVSSNSNFSIGELYSTLDGGNSWKLLPAPPVGDTIRFTSQKVGWLAGGPAGNQLFVTRNSGNSWQSVTTSFLSTTNTLSQIAFDLPYFFNDQEGILPVTFTGQQNPGVSFYKSTDGGKTWNFSSSVKSQQELSLGSKIATSIVKPNLEITAPSGKEEIVAVEDNQPVKPIAPKQLPTEAAIIKLDFQDSTDGWILTLMGNCDKFKSQCDQETILYTTSSSGHTLTEITPLSSSTASPNATQTSALQGFDKCNAPSIPQMQTWWNSSPYKNVNIYFSGNERGCANQTYLNNSWVSQVSSMGWGLIPTVIGPQALFDNISLDPVSATNQGIAEANSASDAASALGLNPQTVIYYDMEGYDTSNHPCSSACRNAANAFLKGWDTQLHIRGNIAGIYGSAGASHAADWYNLAVPPDAVWISVYPFNPPTYDPNASVWGLGNGITDSMWSNHQRIHQYNDTHDASYGGVSFTGNSGIDSDAIDGIVATLCNSLTVTKLNDDGSCGTLRNALSVAGSGSQKTVTIALASGSTIILSSGLVVPAGVTLNGICTNNSPTITLNGGGAAGNGLTLSGDDIINGIIVTGFSGYQIYSQPSSGGFNNLTCVSSVS